MKLVGVVMVKNEADVIEAFVRHNLLFLDRLLIIDHQSSDATVKIVMALAAEGLPIDLMRDTAIAFRQGDRIGEMARLAFTKHGANHVFALDADEFIAAESRSQLVDLLQQVPRSQSVCLPWRNFVPEDAPPSVLHPLSRIQLRAFADVEPLTKLVLGRHFVEDNLAIGHGNHLLLRVVNGQVVTLPPVPLLAGVELAHVPFRSINQFVAKIVLSWFGNRLLQGKLVRISETNWHWRDLFDRYIAGDTPDWAQMRAHALRSYLLTPDAKPQALPIESARLVLEPLPHDPMLRYTADHTDDPMRLLAVWVERLLDRQLESGAGR